MIISSALFSRSETEAKEIFWYFSEINGGIKTFEEKTRD
jgi:hypothetical protein